MKKLETLLAFICMVGIFVMMFGTCLADSNNMLPCVVVFAIGMLLTIPSGVIIRCIKQ